MAGEHLYNSESVAEHWEFEEVNTENIVLKTSVMHNRGKSKEPILI